LPKFYRQQGARQPGDIISYRRATSSRNQRATSSESADTGEVRVNKLLIGPATVPLIFSVAFAGQPLSEKEMDAVTAGFSAFSTSLAESFGGVTAAATANLAEVSPAMRTITELPPGSPVPPPVLDIVVFGEVTLTRIKSVSAAQSTSTAANLPSLTPNVPPVPPAP
jgi:hypothetical protein